jgi:nucleoside-diphosphate-sugar epimerase
MLLVADIEKIRCATGWTPRIALEEALEDLVPAYGLREGRASHAHPNSTPNP